MKKMRVYVIACCCMMLTVVFGLVVLSTLVYYLKWQADKAMVGIIVVYMLSGFTGGVGYKWMQERQYVEKCSVGIKRKATEALLLSAIFLFLLLCISILGLQIPFALSGRFLLIVALLMGSCFLGRIL